MPQIARCDGKLREIDESIRPVLLFEIRSIFMKSNEVTSSVVQTIDQMDTPVLETEAELQAKILPRPDLRLCPGVALTNEHVFGYRPPGIQLPILSLSVIKVLFKEDYIRSLRPGWLIAYYSKCEG